MSGIAAAVAGTAVIGAISSRNASKRAADTAQKTSDAQLAYMSQQNDQARADINRLFPQAAQARNQGYQQSMDLLSSAMPLTIGAVQQGNMNAQNTIAGSMPQMQNAILGNAPIDYSFMQPQQVNVDYQSMLAGLPTLYDPTQQAQGGTPPNPYVDTGAVMRNPVDMNSDVLAQLGGYLSGNSAAYIAPNGGRTPDFFNLMRRK